MRAARIFSFSIFLIIWAQSIIVEKSIRLGFSTEEGHFLGASNIPVNYWDDVHPAVVFSVQILSILSCVAVKHDQS